MDDVKMKQENVKQILEETSGNAVKRSFDQITGGEESAMNVGVNADGKRRKLE